ncbi:hypothetical protein CAPTEDRAFT_215556 [Capitella teleta]|uniref:Uncharacterized protein n=1 Tax=Capitella teleta TaxID=283909 RepID=R7U9V8_CAPTE|nr:hypothetical protein CAPTEDRAFT_215556 [Capitella teleta]|eukprot:ELU02774.1 hypothetical protein CAPTEDRAFT_215556 [Capitella teleta]
MANSRAILRLGRWVFVNVVLFYIFLPDKAYRLSAVSEEKARRVQERIEEFLEKVKEFEKIEELSDVTRIQIMRLEFALNTSLDLYQYRQILNQHPFGKRPNSFFDQATSMKEVREIMNRLRSLPSSVNHAIEQMKVAATSGIVMDNSTFQRVTENICIEQNWCTFDDQYLFQLANPKSEIERQLIANATILAAKTDSVVCSRLTEYFCNEHAAQVRTNISLSAIPRGREFYEAVLRKSTTSNLTPAEIHALGRSEIERIKKEMERIKTDEGFNGTLKEYMTTVKNNADSYIHDEQEFKDAFISLVDVLDEKSSKFTYPRIIPPLYLPGMPGLSGWPSWPLYKSFVEVFISDDPLLRWQNVSAAWRFIEERNCQSGVSTGRRYWTGKGKFFLTDERGAIISEHCFEVINQEELLIVALFRSVLILRETKEWKSHLEECSKTKWFERYDIEMLRAARLVFETGIHYYGLGHELNDDEIEMIFVRRWSKEEARDFIMEHTTLTSQRASVEAASYKIGELKIWELRRLAEEKLGMGCAVKGDRFDLREFNHQVLIVNRVPLDALEYYITRWLNATVAQSANHSMKELSCFLTMMACAVVAMATWQSL